ncbi:MAG TPA: ribonuclease P protein subunit [Nitrososphaerales archaeon]|nr:ribonuclease P protein subunit [Nitrososphaerales archaeon]
MNVIGERLTVLTSSDPTKAGMNGRVVLETAQTLILDTGTKEVRVEKSGSAFLLNRSKKVLTGSDIEGRLQDRWGRRQ